MSFLPDQAELNQLMTDEESNKKKENENLMEDFDTFIKKQAEELNSIQSSEVNSYLINEQNNYMQQSNQNAQTNPLNKAITPAILERNMAFSNQRKTGIEKNTKKRKEKGSRGFGRPEPCRFIFKKDEFPFEIQLPENILRTKDSQGNIVSLKENDILVFLDDCLMYFKIENNRIKIKFNKEPFEKLYSPQKYDNLGITVVVYRNNGRFVPTPGVTITENFMSKNNIQNNNNTSNTNTISNSNDMDTSKETKIKKDTKVQSAHGEIIYKGTFRFYMKPDLDDLASDSESDQDEQAIPKGVVAKRRYNMSEYLQLSMTDLGKTAFYSVIQAYLRGAFFNGDSKQIAEEKTKRNESFTKAMKNGVPAARKYVSDMLGEVSKYYIKYCNNEKDYLKGLIQLLDFCHSLGVIGLIPSHAILHAVQFFKGKGNSSKKDVSEDLTPDFVANIFGEMSISNEPTAFDNLDIELQNNLCIEKNGNFLPPPPLLLSNSSSNNNSNSNKTEDNMQDENNTDKDKADNMPERKSNKVPRKRLKTK